MRAQFEKNENVKTKERMRTKMNSQKNQMMN